MILLDGDSVVYQVGFANETANYVATCPLSGVIEGFQTLKDAYAEGYSKEDLTFKPIPANRSKVEPYLDRVINTIKKKAGKKFNSEMRIFLTNEDINENFRKKIHLGYKQNRSGKPKPVYYQLVRELLVNKYGAEVVTGYEADDALAIHRTEGSIICTKDKDLKSVSGYHMNLMDYTKFKVPPGLGELEIVVKDNGNKDLKGVGFMWFIAQMFLGDNIDNIQGIKGYGPVKIYNVFSTVGTKKSAWELTKAIYRKRGREEDININANLLWMLREEGDYFDEEKI